MFIFTCSFCLVKFRAWSTLTNYYWRNLYFPQLLVPILYNHYAKTITSPFPCIPTFYESWNVSSCYLCWAVVVILVCCIYCGTQSMVLLTTEKEKIVDVNDKINDWGNCIFSQFHSLLETFHLINVCYLCNLSFEEWAKDFSCIKWVIVVATSTSFTLAYWKLYLTETPS